MSRSVTVYEWNDLSADERARLLERPAVRDNREIESQAASIIERARAEGLAGLIQITRELDDVDLDDIRVSPAELDAAKARIGSAAVSAIDRAIDNITRFHEAQATPDIRVETSPGVVCERFTRPVQSAGLYVPAGSAPLPSTAIMLAVPARLAGCPVRSLCTPPRPDGSADPAVLVAAARCDVSAVFKLGGAQAVAAMAYGIEPVPKADKIFGPGNAWFTAAKKLVASDPLGAALDIPAGPSEVMVIADESADPRHVALDLLAQSEHGPDSQAILLSTDGAVAAAAAELTQRIARELPRRDIIEAALENAAVIVVQDLGQAMEVANCYAPEHLIIQVNEPRSCLESLHHAGSVFLGPWTPESVGDYCSGTNHVLPTYGYAKAYSGLGLADFQKRITVQELTRQGLDGLGPVVTTLARLENLEAHARAVEVRQKD